MTLAIRQCQDSRLGIAMNISYMTMADLPENEDFGSDIDSESDIDRDSGSDEESDTDEESREDKEDRGDSLTRADDLGSIISLLACLPGMQGP
jgi:hypothetical protein